MPLATIVIPCYNEEKTLRAIIDRVLEIQNDELKLEIIIVDDCSKDRSLEIARGIAAEIPAVKVLHHEVNQGKGAALRTGFQHATGDVVAIQDADLEYDPHDLKKLMKLIFDGRADVVYGSRFLTPGAHRVLYFWHSVGNKFLTFLSNVLTDLNLTDMETCYKVFRREIIQAVQIEENRFGFEPEIVAKVARMNPRTFEQGISYDGRTYAEGKKIGAKDGFRAIYCIYRYNTYTAPLSLQYLVFLPFLILGVLVAGLKEGILLRLPALDTIATPSAYTAFALIIVASLGFLFWRFRTGTLLGITVTALIAAAGYIPFIGLRRFFMEQAIAFPMGLSLFLTGTLIFLLSRFLNKPE